MGAEREYPGKVMSIYASSDQGSVYVDLPQAQVRFVRNARNWEKEYSKTLAGAEFDVGSTGAPSARRRGPCGRCVETTW